MRKNKILVILMSIVLLIATFVSAANVGTYSPARVGEEPAPEGNSDAPTIPDITVAGVGVGDAFFELSLRVSARQFQTVGVVLSYDAAVLTPVAWTGGETNDDGTPKAVELSAHKDWNSPEILPTKGADGLAGKPALAYMGYETDTGETEGTEGSAGEAVETPTGRAYLYLGADTLKYAELKDERVVTVRFQGDPTKVTMPTALADYSDERYTVCLAPAHTAAVTESIPGVQVLATTSGDGGTLTSYDTYTAPAASTSETEGGEGGAGEETGGETGGDTGKTPCTLQFKLGDWPSADGSGGGSGDYAITFFDWDGRVIDAIAAPQDAAQAVADWQAQQPIKDRLANKPGYEFESWLVVEQTEDGLKSEHSALTSRKAAAGTTPADQADFADLSKYTEDPSVSVLVQAAYKTTEDVNGKNGEDASLAEDYSRYQFGQPTFYQYGSVDQNNGQYALRCTVDRNDVLRADVPTVMVQVNVGSGSDMQMVTVKVDLENTDSTGFEVVVPKNTTSVSYQVLDTYGKTNWTTGEERSMIKRVDHAEIVRGGAFALLADEAYRASQGGTWTNAVNAQCFIDAGYTRVTESNLEDAKTALANATATNGAPLDRAGADQALTAYK